MTAQFHNTISFDSSFAVVTYITIMTSASKKKFQNFFSLWTHINNYSSFNRAFNWCHSKNNFNKNFIHQKVNHLSGTYSDFRIGLSFYICLCQKLHIVRNVGESV